MEIVRKEGPLHVETVCPKCLETFWFEAAMKGKSGKCPHCHLSSQLKRRSIFLTRLIQNMSFGGEIAAGIGFAALFIFVVFAPAKTSSFVLSQIASFLAVVVIATVALLALAGLPLLIFKKGRFIAGCTISLIGIGCFAVFWLSCTCISLVTVGKLKIFLAMLFAGIGTIPIGIYELCRRSEWAELGKLAAWVTGCLCAMFLGNWMLEAEAKSSRQS